MSYVLGHAGLQICPRAVCVRLEKRGDLRDEPRRSEQHGHEKGERRDERRGHPKGGPLEHEDDGHGDRRAWHGHDARHPRALVPIHAVQRERDVRGDLGAVRERSSWTRKRRTDAGQDARRVNVCGASRSRRTQSGSAPSVQCRALSEGRREELRG